MSEKSLKEFFEKVAEDKKLQEKLKALHKKAKENRDKEREALVKLAGQAGFKISAADLKKVRQAGVKEGEVREVAGQSDCYYGKNYFCNAAYLCGYSVYHN